MLSNGATRVCDGCHPTSVAVTDRSLVFPRHSKNKSGLSRYLSVSYRNNIDNFRPIIPWVGRDTISEYPLRLNQSHCYPPRKAFS
jgi:hypothetical protein